MSTCPRRAEAKTNDPAHRSSLLRTRTSCFVKITNPGRTIFLCLFSLPLDFFFCVGNTIYGNGDAGLSLVETSRCVVSENEMEDNRWGLRVILGSTDNVVSDSLPKAYVPFTTGVLDKRH